VFIVAHVDYVRSVHVMPLGPERTQLTVNWMLLPQTLASGAVDIPALIALGNQVVQEDARVCELNQKGLRSLRHHSGVLVPQEYDILAFDNWVMDRLRAGTS
jgi:Rieske 2Fe-2S family protein